MAQNLDPDGESPQPEPSATGRVDLGRVLRHGIALAWLKRFALLQAIAMPALVVSGFGFLGEDAGVGMMLLGLLAAWLLGATIAARCHRIALLDEAPPHWLALPDGHAFRLALWMLLVGLASAAFALIPMMMLAALLVGAGGSESAAQLTSLLMLGLMAFLMARFALVAPAAALDQAPGLGKAWRQSEGNFFSLLAIIALPMFLGGLLGAFTTPGSIASVLVQASVQLFVIPIATCWVSLAYRQVALPAPLAPETD
ncbi:MAG: hypothetical protein AAGE01_18100 [Pseudomonadota bacterium]